MFEKVYSFWKILQSFAPQLVLQKTCQKEIDYVVNVTFALTFIMPMETWGFFWKFASKELSDWIPFLENC